MKKNFIEAFEKIRDIPYRIPLSLHEADHCCSGKARHLMQFFKEAGYGVRFRVCTFLWSDLKLPDSLQRAVYENECTHVYLEIKINDKWVNVDPTWDCALEGLLPVSRWDGKTDTEIAVPMRALFSVEESRKIMEESLVDSVVEDDLKKNRIFYQAFNEWLECYRKNNYVSIK